MTDVFICYSRKNNDFARKLIDRLDRAYKESWVDWQDIPRGEDWLSEIKAGIEAADNFVFIMSPDSMESIICNIELHYALDLHKRVIPVVYREVTSRREAFASIANFEPDEAMEEHLAGEDPVIIARDNWQRISHLQWLFFREEDDFDEAFNNLIKAVEIPTIKSTENNNIPYSHIYIAYSSDSLANGFIPQLLNQLNSQNYAPWIDFQNYLPREDWQVVATPAIEQASMMIVVVTPQSMRSEGVLWEVSEAQRAGVPIIPVIIESTPLRDTLREYSTVNLVNRGQQVEATIALTGVLGEIFVGDRRLTNGDVVPMYFEYDFEPLIQRLDSINVTNLHGAFNDRVAEEDQLEFKHYVFALSDLIMSPATTPPITVGIFGSWGAGKSFLLDHIKRKITKTAPYDDSQDDAPEPLSQRIQQSQNYFFLFRPFVKLGIITNAFISTFFKLLANQLKRLAKRLASIWNSVLLTFFDVKNTDNSADVEVGIEIVDFNAWEYSATDIVWPGLVRKIMTLLEKEVSIPTRIRVRFTRNLKQQLSKLQLWLLLFVSAVVGVVIFNIWTDSVLSQGITIIGVIGLSASLIKILTDLFAHPMARWLTTLFEHEDYGRQIGYMEEIRHDLELLEQGLKRKNKRVLIIVDDLDRCEPEKAVEMLQAVKLLLNFDSFIVILGIDARIITRAIERHYSDLLGPAGASGYEYLDKIIQIPFRIPKPIETEIRSFIDRQMSGETEETEPLILNEAQDTVDEPQQAPDNTVIENSESTATQQDNPDNQQAEQTKNPIDWLARERLNINRTWRPLAFTPEERAIFKQLAMLIKPNPRHIKRLINVYRLIKTLAEYRKEPFINNNRRKTIHWVVLCGQWPYTVHVILQIYKELLEDDFEAKQTGEKSECFPQVENVLVYLYEIAEKQLDATIRARLDYDPDQFHWLVTECKLNWEELAKLRMYTVNFNPAVEAETRQVFHVQNRQTQIWVE